MNSTEFVAVIKLTVGHTVVDDINNILEKPAGRSPEPKLLKLAAWYNDLSTTDRENLTKVISLTVDHSLFGFFCVLDGVRAIENGADKGELILEYHKNGLSTRLNGTDEMLHDIYNAE